MLAYWREKDLKEANQKDMGDIQVQKVITPSQLKKTEQDTKQLAKVLRLSKHFQTLETPYQTFIRKKRINN